MRAAVRIYLSTIATIICDLRTLANSLFHDWRQVMETTVSVFMVSLSRTACHAICSQQTYCWLPQGADCKHFCL